MPIEDRVMNLTTTTKWFLKKDGYEVFVCLDCKGYRIGKVGSRRCKRCAEAKREQFEQQEIAV
jgi:hypothetical protein